MLYLFSGVINDCRYTVPALFPRNNLYHSFIVSVIFFTVYVKTILLLVCFWSTRLPGLQYIFVCNCACLCIISNWSLVIYWSSVTCWSSHSNNLDFCVLRMFLDIIRSTFFWWLYFVGMGNKKCISFWVNCNIYCKYYFY